MTLHILQFRNKHILIAHFKERAIHKTKQEAIEFV